MSVLFILATELGNITILPFIVILQCHNNRYRRETFSIIISLTWYYHKYCNYYKIHCSETCTWCSTSITFYLIFTILVAVVLLSDIMIILWSWYTLTWDFCYRGVSPIPTDPDGPLSRFSSSSIGITNACVCQVQQEASSERRSQGPYSSLTPAKTFL